MYLLTIIRIGFIILHINDNDHKCIPIIFKVACEFNDSRNIFFTSESKEVLMICIKRLKNLNKDRLVHAEFIWSEPYLKRIKVKLRI